jgi:hypothetical protein
VGYWLLATGYWLVAPDGLCIVMAVKALDFWLPTKANSQ